MEKLIKLYLERFHETSVSVFKQDLGLLLNDEEMI